MKVVQKHEKQLLLMVSSKGFGLIGFILFFIGVLAILYTGPKLIVQCQEKFPGLAKQCQLKRLYLGFFPGATDTLGDLTKSSLTPSSINLNGSEQTLTLNSAQLSRAYQISTHKAFNDYFSFEDKKSLTLPTRSTTWDTVLLFYLILVGFSGMVFIGHAYLYLDKTTNELTYVYRKFFSRERMTTTLNNITVIAWLDDSQQLALLRPDDEPFLLLKNVPVSLLEKRRFAIAISEFLAIDNQTIEIKQ